MSPILLLIIAIAIVVILVAAWYAYDRRRSGDLRSTFGREYDRTVKDAGDRRTAENELRERQARVDALDIRPLAPDDRDRYAREWRDVQARFVDEPRPAIDEADDLIGRLMQDRGYPVADFDQRVADISVGHADVVEHYRAAHAIAERDDVTTNTEDLRQAMVHYRALFEDLLGSGDGREAAPPTRTTTKDPELTRRAS
jgi:FtsZ-interacting cell division protein ZipA